MTPEKAKIYLAWVPYIQAVADGKTVQRKQQPFAPWKDCDPSVIDDYIEEGSAPVEDFWRIKPGPREFWIVVTGDAPHQVWEAKPDPEMDFGEYAELYEIIHVREVLPE